VKSVRLKSLSRLVSLALTGVAVVPAVMADDSVNLGTVGAQTGASEVIEVSAKRGTASAVAPTQANLEATQPESIISRSFIEEMVAPTGNYNTIIGIAPSAATQPSPNGPGLADTKTTLRGFQDNQYNVTWDGIPFGDTNDPSHHSTSYFPASVIGGASVERGPGGASTLGQATYGGSVNLYSKVPAAVESAEVFGSYGSWNTRLLGASFESGRGASGQGPTLQVTAQDLHSDGYLTYNTIASDNIVVKFQTKIGESTRLTVFGTYGDVQTGVTDNASGATQQQAALFGQNYSMNNDPTSQGYYGYNHVHKRTDMEYVRLQSSLGGGWEVDNNIYSYYYDNKTIAGYDPTGYLGTGVPIAAGATPDTGSKIYGVKFKSGVPGYDKLNHYRVTGDIFKITDQTSAGLFRAGLWYDHADTNRHNFLEDVSTGTYDTDFATYGLKSNQKSGWNQYQPFAEFEWAATQDLTVTPGVKYMHFVRSVNAIFNQGSKVPANFSETYTDTLPFLTANYHLGKQDAVYVQFAKGLQVPTLDQLQVATPENSPKPQTTTNYQFGWVHKSATLVADADIYYINFDNMIGTQQDPVTHQTVFLNQGGAVYKGIEGELTYVMGGGWSFYANGSINRANYTANNVLGNFGEVPKSPESTMAFGLLYNQGPWNASVVYKDVGPQYEYGGNPSAYHIASFSNVDLNAAYTINSPSSFLKKTKIEFSVFNLGDTHHVTSISQGNTPALDQFQWQAPRSYMLSLRSTF